MRKIYRATITLTIEPDEEGFLEWQDGDDDPIDNLENYAANELAEIVFDAVKFDRLDEIISVEVIEKENA